MAWKCGRIRISGSPLSPSLFEGGIFHRDSLGYAQAIRPGYVNWMTAGSGIAHSERTEPEMKKSGFTMHGVQTWVALPRAHSSARRPVTRRLVLLVAGAQSIQSGP